MAEIDAKHPIQHIGNTILVVMMEVDQGHEEEFDRWYNDEHLPERLEISGYVSARRFKLREGEGEFRTSEQLPGCDSRKQGVLGEAVAADAEAGLPDVRVRRTFANRRDDLE